MNLGIVGNALKKVTRVVSKNSPTILTGLAVGGVVATGIMAVKGDRKAQDMKVAHEMDSELLVEGQAIFDEDGVTEQKPCRFRERTTAETIKLTWRCYVPAGLMGMATICCIVGANTINVKRNVALATAYSLSEEAAKEFKDKVKETVGEKKVQKMENEIMQEKVNNNPAPADENICYTGKGDQLMYDAWSGRYFKSGQMEVEKAVNVLNKMMIAKKQSVSMNEYYEMIGLPLLSNAVGDEFGWNFHQFNEGEDITVDFYPVFSNDQTPCIGVKFEPELLYTYGEV